MSYYEYRFCLDDPARLVKMIEKIKTRGYVNLSFHLKSTKTSMWNMYVTTDKAIEGALADMVARRFFDLNGYAGYGKILKSEIRVVEEIDRQYLYI